jgi:hypothetical protein
MRNILALLLANSSKPGEPWFTSTNIACLNRHLSNKERPELFGNEERRWWNGVSNYIDEMDDLIDHLWSSGMYPYVGPNRWATYVYDMKVVLETLEHVWLLDKDYYKPRSLVIQMLWPFLRISWKGLDENDGTITELRKAVQGYIKMIYIWRFEFDDLTRPYQPDLLSGMVLGYGEYV